MATCKNCIHEKVCKYTNEKISIGTTVGETVHECKDHVSAADVVEVVRCKDCVHFITEFLGKDIEPICKNKNAMIEPKPNLFCSYGERKES